MVRARLWSLLLALALTLIGLSVVASSTAIAAASPPVPIITPSTAKPSQALEITGSLAPASKRLVRPVVLQRLQGSSWVSAGSGSTTKKATYSFSLTAPPAAGAYSYRVFAKKVNVTVKGKKVKLPALTSSTRNLTVTATATPPPPDTTPPPVPTGLSATSGDTTASLTWTAVAATDLAGYLVYTATSSGGPWTKHIGNPTLAPNYAASGLTNGTTYLFAVTSVDLTGNESARSSPTSATPTSPDTTPPHVPVGLSARAGDTNVSLSWTGVSATDLAGYQVYRSTNPGGPWTNLSATPQASTAYAAMGLMNGTTYYFAVTSIDTSGNESAKSALVNETPDNYTGPNHCGTLTESEIWRAGTVHILDCSVEVPNGSTLTIRPGAVIKAKPAGVIGGAGALVANGTSGQPVTFTSFRDDTVGGDTNGDGSATTPAPGDWGGIQLGYTGSADLAHADVRYPTQVVNGGDDAHLSITDSQVRDTGTTAVTANRLTTPPVVMNTSFVRASFGEGPVLVNQGSVDLSKLAGNTVTGPGARALMLDSVDFAVDTTLPLTGDLIPVLRDGYGRTRITSGTTLTLNPGAILKSGTQSGYGSYIQVNGALVANGTSGQPVTFTSFRDDTVGGDTNGDGSATTPAPGDWGGVSVVPDGRVNLNGTTLQFAAAALSVADGAEAEVHGKIANSNSGVSSSAYVNATNVDWGDPSGPGPVGLGTPVSGDGVNFFPWVGYKPPPVPPSTPDPAPNPEPACPSYYFIGARGSGEPPQGDPPTYPSPSGQSLESYQSAVVTAMGTRVSGIYYGFKERAESQGSTVAPVVLRYRALGVGNIPFLFGHTNYWSSIWQGVNAVIDEMARIRGGTCGGTSKIVLAGYSQGALAIHLALTKLADAGQTTALSSAHLSAVVLLADPAKTKNGEGTIWEQVTGDDTGYGGTGVTKAKGIWITGFDEVAPAALGALTYIDDPIPDEVQSRTLTMCHNHDIVCAPGVGGIGFLSSKHTNYSDAETFALGRWAASNGS